MEFVNIAKHKDPCFKCHDCGQKIRTKDKSIENGTLLVYDNNGQSIKVFKCNDCFALNPSLINFRKCEVYSRVVGYIRPVSQWHIGKKQEFRERKDYKQNKKIIS